MHKEVIHFIKFVSEILSVFFSDKVVMDIGGGDINGNNRYAFKNVVYHCNDVCASPNVTDISRTKDLQFPANAFDTIISTECFEHDPEYEQSFLKIYDMLKPNGLFVFTCASTGRPEHGTSNHKPHQSFGTICGFEDMKDYYKNLDESDLNKIVALKDIFVVYKTYYNSFSKDLYFFGIKHGDADELMKEKYGDIQYVETHVQETPTVF